MFGYYPFGFYMDPGYILVLITAILSMVEQYSTGINFILPLFTTKKDTGVIFTPAPLPPPNGFL